MTRDELVAAIARDIAGNPKFREGVRRSIDVNPMLAQFALDDAQYAWLAKLIAVGLDELERHGVRLVLPDVDPADALTPRSELH